MAALLPGVNWARGPPRAASRTSEQLLMHQASSQHTIKRKTTKKKAFYSSTTSFNLFFPLASHYCMRRTQGPRPAACWHSLLRQDDTPKNSARQFSSPRHVHTITHHFSFTEITKTLACLWTLKSKPQLTAFLLTGPPTDMAANHPALAANPQSPWPCKKCT